MKKAFSYVVNAFGVLFLLFVVATCGSVFMAVNGGKEKLDKNSVLVLELDGVIIDGSEFLEKLRKYRKDDNVKAIVVKLNSPGGVVGPSQEIYAELKRTREQFKKPVVATCGALAASGAFYAAMAADKIVTNPGCLMGSIGVIMEFANLEHLYHWAKIERYALKTGAYKDAGSDYRPMTAEEKALFQVTLNEVLGQFKAAIVEGRQLKPELVDANADGRIFTGAHAVKLGFADQIGTYDDALKLAGELAGISGEPHVFAPKKRTKLFLEIFDEASQESKVGNAITNLFENTFQLNLMGRPLFIMPGVLGK